MKSLLTHRVDCSAILSMLLALPGAATAQITTHDVDIDSPQFTLYTDPYNGNQIKIGGFSGIYPVPGKPDSFYIITDRGPAPDFIDRQDL